MANEETYFSKLSLGFPKIASIDDKPQFVAFRLDVCWNQMDWHRKMSPNILLTSFAIFSADHFKKTDENDCREPGDLAGGWVVYVQDGHTTVISKALYAVFREDILWPQARVSDCSGKSDMEKRELTKRTKRIRVKVTKEMILKMTNLRSPPQRSRIPPTMVIHQICLVKAHSFDYEKYNGETTDRIDRNYFHFLNVGNQADITKDDHFWAISMMLTERAHKLYPYSLWAKSLKMDGLAKNMKIRIHTPERSCARFPEWDSLSPNVLLTANLYKTHKTPLERV